MHSGQVQTVLGTVPAERLGVVLTHEHLLMDISNLFSPDEAVAAGERDLAYQPVRLENRFWVACHSMSNLENTRLRDEEAAIKEVLYFKKAGGGTIVDVGNFGLHRDPSGLRRIALATGLNVIMGSGYYVSATHTADMNLAGKSEDQIAEEIIRDITQGVGNTGLRSGIIGEIGCTWPLADNERKVLRAAGLAQKHTGAAITIHPGRSPRAPFEIIEILAEAGGDVRRTVIGHIERTIRDLKTLSELLETGCYIAYDLFGWEGYYPRSVQKVDLPNDAQRVNELSELIARGYLRRLLISHDIGMKMRLRMYGGHGYGHILENVVPLMRDKGLSDKQISTILVENPKQLLQFP